MSNPHGKCEGQGSPRLPRAEIVILNYRGRDLLPECLPSIVRAAEAARTPTEVVVLHNPGGPEEESGLDYVQKAFPRVRIVRAPENLVLGSYNDYVRNSRAAVVILLNNDIRVAEDFVDPLLERFEADPAAFLVAPQSRYFNEPARVEAGRSKGGVRWGLFWCEARYPGYEKDASEPGPTFSSGFGAFSREKFAALGGYDLRYLPGIMEDVDLCYRARQAGYHLYYEPRSVVYHMGQASFRREFGGERTRELAWRNTFLFMWKNFRSPFFWIAHLVFLPLRFLHAALRGRPELMRGFRQAIQKLKTCKRSS